ncbi:MAG: type II and III secretion system protein, partial [Candidatus Sumerlaeota bacterium]|nr:type II and III secretion system protein [Candidatus Sumerlaeota bacterium]
VGQEVPFVTNSRITQDGQTINTIEYQDIGIILDVTPHINDDGVVILDVYPEISALTGDTVQISDTLTAPVFAKRSATSRVVVPNQHTVVIGGLMEDKNTEDVKKVPLIGDIPYLGWLFQRKVTSKSKTELLIFLTPTVVQEYEAVSDEAAAERDKAKLLPKALGGSSFQEYMENLGAGKDGQPLRTTVSPMKHLNGSPRKEKAE